MYRSQTKMAAGVGHDPNCTCKNVDFGQAREGNILWDFVNVRTLICCGETLKVLRWHKLIRAFENKLQTLYDFMNSYTVEWIHNDKCSWRAWLELYLQREHELRRYILVAGTFSLYFDRSAVQLLRRHFTIPSSRPFVISYRPVFVSTAIVSTPCASIHHHLKVSVTSWRNHAVVVTGRRNQPA